MALLAVLLLPAGEARARNECGPLMSGAATCVDQAYANGIRYDVTDDWFQGVAGDIALTVIGGPATTLSLSSAVTGWGSGIVLRTAEQGSSDTTSRTVALTVGTGSNPVAIEQPRPSNYGGFYNTGVVIHQRGRAADSTTVTLGPGVRIASGMTSMRKSGVHVQVDNGANTGTHTIDSAATIYSAEFGLMLDNRGGGNSVVINSGSVTTTTNVPPGTSANNKSGIRIIDKSGSRGDDRTASTTTTVTNSGSVTVSAASAHGIEVDAEGLGLYRTVNSGTVRASGATGHGIFLNARWHMGAAGTAAIEIENSGAIATTGARGYGIYVETVDAAVPQGRGSGNVAIANSGSISSANHAIVVSANMGAISVTHSGGSITSTAADGIRVLQAGAAVTVSSSAGVTARNYGIFLTNDVAVVSVSGGVTATTSQGAVSVTHSAGAIAAGTEAGIYARNAAGNPDAVTVAVGGGSVTTRGQNKPAVQVLQMGTGGAFASVASGATLDSRHGAGIHVRLGHADNAAGRIGIVQNGAISGGTGVRAEVPRASAAGEARAAAAQPLIDVAWTGTFSHGTTATAARNGGARFTADGAGTRPIALHEDVPGAETGQATRYGMAAGIEAHAMDWRAAAKEVAKGDDPGAFADAAAQAALFDAGADAATRARAATVLAAFRTQLATDPQAIPDVDSVDANDDETHTDAEITAYLTMDDDDRRTFLRNILAEHLSEKETAVLRAVVTDTGLDAALDDEDANFSDAYKAAVKALLERYNVGDVRIAMNGGSIASQGDGIRAYYATPHAMNGAIEVTIAAGATVGGGMAGIHAANAGMGTVSASSDRGRSLLLTGDETLRQQFVTVQGMVTGGSDAAVHLSGGGALLVGRMGQVFAGSSGRAILVNEPGRSVIVIDGVVRGGSGQTAAIETTGGGRITLGRTGRVVLAEGATNAICANREFRCDDNRDRESSSGATMSVTLLVPDLYEDSAEKARDRLGGRPGGGAVVGTAVGGSVVIAVRDEDGTTGMMDDVPLDANGRLDVPAADLEKRPPPPAPPPTDTGRMDCGLASDDRCRLYEALPSVLLAMNGLPSYGERLASARSQTGGWARVEASRGEWEAEDSTRAGVAYDHDRAGVRAGIDAAVGGDARIGVSVHGLQGEAEMAQNGGKMELTGMGVGVNATALAGGGVYIDAQAQATWFDAEVTSSQGRTLMKTDGIDGAGWALALEAGRPMAMGRNLSLTPSIGFVWSQVSLDDFTDSRGTRVSVEDADSLVGRLGLAVSADVGGGLRLSGSLDAMQEFSEETEVRLPGTDPLKASSETTSFRLGIGGAHSWGEGRYALRGSASYTAGGGDNSAFGGGLSLSVAF